MTERLGLPQTPTLPRLVNLSSILGRGIGGGLPPQFGTKLLGPMGQVCKLELKGVVIMANLISVPGLSLTISYDREQIAEAAAQAAAGVAYRITKGSVRKGLSAGEKAVQQGSAARAVVDRNLAEAAQVSHRVAAASGRKAARLIDEQVGHPIKSRLDLVRSRQVKAHDQIRARLDQYCGDLPPKAAITLALPEATASVVAPIKKRRQRANIKA